MGILSAPVKGLFYIFEEVASQVEHELYDDDAIREKLTELYQKLEAGLVEEDEFERIEENLVLQLEEVEERKKQRGRRGAIPCAGGACRFLDPGRGGVM